MPALWTAGRGRGTILFVDGHGPARADDSAAARPGLLAEIRRRRGEFEAAGDRAGQRTYPREE